MTICEYRLEQLKNLKGKPFREKWAYIIEYFVLQILLVIAVIVAGVFFVVKVSSEKDPALSVACINATPNYDVRVSANQKKASRQSSDLLLPVLYDVVPWWQGLRCLSSPSSKSTLSKA